MLKARRKETYADLGKMRLTGKDDDTPIQIEDGTPDLVTLFAAARLKLKA